MTTSASFISAKANLLQQVKRAAFCAARGRSRNELRTRQAVRGSKEMFRKDGLLKAARMQAHR
jgi:hypothetical protein